VFGDFHAYYQIKHLVAGYRRPQVLSLEVALTKKRRFHEKAGSIDVIAIHPEPTRGAKIHGGSEPGSHAATDIDNRSYSNFIE